MILPSSNLTPSLRELFFACVCVQTAVPLSVSLEIIADAGEYQLAVESVERQRFLIGSPLVFLVARGHEEVFR